MRSWCLLLAWLGVCVNCSAFAQLPAQTLVIHAGTLLAVPGEAPKSRQTLIIRNGRVAEVRAGFIPAQEIGASAPIELIDLSGRVVLPGMIDLHVHLTTEAEEGELLRAVTLGAADLALVGRRHAKDTLDAGFTTVLDLGTARRAHNEAIYALRRAIDRGMVVGPRLLVAGSPISATGSSRTGHQIDAIEAVVGPTGTCDGPEACSRVVREQVAGGADAINLYNTGSLGDRQLTEQAMTAAEMRAVILTAHSLGRKVIADGHTSPGINAALRAGADIIDTAPWPDAQSFRLLRRHGVFLEPHMQAFVVAVGEMRSGSMSVADQLDSPVLARLRSVLERPFAAQTAHERGVRLAYGSDTGIIHHGDNAGDLLQLRKIGLSPMQAIEVATINSAEAIGLRGEIGSLEVGKRADVIATDGDPLADLEQLRHVTFVMRDGHVFKMQ